MQPDLYQRFAARLLSDLAERRDQNGAKLARGRRREERVSGESRRVRIRGDHICYLGQEVFRDSDCSVRLAMAVKAYEKAYALEKREPEKAHGANSWACTMVAEMILSPSCERLRERFLQARRGPKPHEKETTPTQPFGSANPGRPSILQSEQHDSRFEELDALIAMEPRQNPKSLPGRAARAKVALELPPEVRNLAKVVRSQVYQFRRTYARECNQRFEAEFGAFRAENSRDAQWYAEAEVEFKQRLADLELKLGCHDQQTAAATAALAYHLHRQQKFDDAIEVYSLAQERWKVATPVTEERRTAALAIIADEITSCLQRRLTP